MSDIFLGDEQDLRASANNNQIFSYASEVSDLNRKIYTGVLIQFSLKNKAKEFVSPNWHW